VPNVPNVLGVPLLSSYGAAAPVLLIADTALIISRALQPQWGIYNTNGTPYIASSLASLLGLGSLASALNTFSSLLIGQNISDLFSVVDFEFKRDWTVSDYPVEQGGFQSYDKVQTPFEGRMRVCAGGNLVNRQALIDKVDTAANSLNLYTIYTPEETYINANITHYDYARKADRGAGLIMVDIWLSEIRITSTAAFGNTQQPGNASQVGLGNAQPGPSAPMGSLVVQ
jgi:hypothetical protein